MHESADFKNCSYNELYALQVLDDSMEPEFPQNCVIVIEPSQRCASGAYVVITVGEERWFRQWREEPGQPPRLLPLNSAYYPIELHDKVWQIEGVIVQRNFKRKSKHYRPYLPNNGEGDTP